MRVLVCGSRTWTTRNVVWLVLDGLRMGIGDDPDFVVIEGGARGADECAREWCHAWHFEPETYPANWQALGKAAGAVRNQQMLRDGKPDVVWAFRMPGESRGTDDMVRRARAAGVPTYVVLQ